MGLFDALPKIRLSFGEKATQQASDNLQTYVTNNSSWIDHTKMQSNLNYFDQYHGYTYVCLNFNALNVASTDIELMYSEDGDSEEEHVRNQLHVDLERFNPYMSLYEARKMTQIHLNMVGTAAWLMVERTDKDGFYEFYMIADPTKLEVKTYSSNGLPESYRLNARNGKYYIFPAKDIIVFQQSDPKNYITSYSTLQASYYSHETIEAMQAWNMNYFKNSARPEGLFVLPAGVKQDVKRQFDAMIKEKFSETGQRGIGSTTMQGLEYKKIMDNQKDTDFIKGMAVNRDDILAIHGIPKALIEPSSTNANTKEMNVHYQRYTLKPKLKHEQGVLNTQLLPRYREDLRTRREFKQGVYYFDFENPIDEDIVEKGNLAASLYEKGVITRAAAKKRIGEEVEDGDDVYAVKSTGDVEELEKTKSVKKKEKRKPLDRDAVRKMYDTKQRESEVSFREEVETFFVEQATRYLDRTKSLKAANVGQLPDLTDEITLTVSFFRERFSNEAVKYNAVANELTGTGEAFSNRMESVIDNNLRFFSEQINETTRQDIVNIVANAVRTDEDITATRSKILGAFNKYIDGQKNIDVLTKLNVYNAPIIQQSGSVVASSQNRYNAMMELITNASKREQLGLEPLSNEDQIQGLKALLGSLDKDDDLAKQMESTLRRLYKVEPFEGISQSRAHTITIHQINQIKNGVSRANYENNQFVNEVEWLSASDGDTRDGHRAASGKRVAVGEKFEVRSPEGSIDMMEYPGDPSASASNTINCRCTLIPVVDEL